MEEHQTEVDQLVRAGVPDGSDSRNLLDQLAEKRREASENRETLIAIPGYEDSGITLYAKYRLLTGPELERIAKAQERGKGKQRGLWTRSLSAACAVMSSACVGIFYQTDEMDEPQPLCFPFPDGQEITGFNDPNLASALKIERADTARALITGVFCDNELAVSTHSVKLNRWFGNTNVEVDDEFLGEGL